MGENIEGASTRGGVHFDAELGTIIDPTVRGLDAVEPCANRFDVETEVVLLLLVTVKMSLPNRHLDLLPLDPPLAFDLLLDWLDCCRVVYISGQILDAMDC